MCPPQASFPRGGMDLLLFGGYHIPADIHILSNKLSSKGLHSSGFILNVFTGMIGWVLSCFITPSHVITRKYPWNCLRNSCQIWQCSGSCMYGFPWLQEVLKDMLKDSLASLSTLQTSHSIMQGQFGFHSSSMLSMETRPEF